MGDSAKVFTRRLASGWTIAGQVSGVSSSHGQLKQVMISEHFKKRQNAHILTKSDKIFAKATKSDKATNAKKTRRTTTKKRQKMTHLSESDKNGNPACGKEYNF